MSNRIVIKEGYLRKIPQKGASIFKKSDQRWFLFLLIGKQPYMEYYEKQEASQIEPPINCFLLRGCLTVTPCLGEYGDCAFLITTAERVLKLVAPSTEEAQGWIGTLNRTLREFGNREMPDNIYGGFPDESPDVLYENDPTCTKKGDEEETDLKAVQRSDGRIMLAENSRNGVPSPKIDWKKQPLPELPPLENEYGMEPGLMQQLQQQKSDTGDDEDDFEELDEIAMEKAAAWATGQHEHEESVYGTTFSDGQVAASAVVVPKPRARAQGGSRQLSLKASHPGASGVGKGIGIGDWLGSFNKVSADLARLEARLNDAGYKQDAEKVRAQQVNSGHLAVDELDDDIYDHIEFKMRELEDWEGLSDLRAKRHQSAASVYKPNPNPPPFDPTQKPLQVAGFFERKMHNDNPGFTMVRQNSVTTTASGTPIPGTGTALYISPGPQTGLSPVLGAVETMKKQILHPGGILVTARAQDLLSSVAFVELKRMAMAGGVSCGVQKWDTWTTEAVWIAGWNTRATRLHNCFRIGDQVVGVNEFYPVDGVTSVKKLIEATPPDQKTRVRLRRTPHAKVFAIARDAEGQSLGLRRDGGTAEIVFVEPKGLAAKHGLTAKATTVGDGGRQLCNWTLTEINNRPLNLFYNKNEIEIRLNAFGKEISLVVQPTDFVQELKKSLKNTKTYKDFVVE